MNRRHFMRCTSAATLVAAVPMATAAAHRPALLDDPRAWVGTEFISSDGARLRLAEVIGVRVDQHTMQANLQFQLVQGEPPREGSHTLQCGQGHETLYLQPGEHGPVACINRLRRTWA